MKTDVYEEKAGNNYGSSARTKEEMMKKVQAAGMPGAGTRRSVPSKEIGMPR